MAAMQAVKDQQRRRTVEKRRQPCGVFVSEGRPDGKTVALAKMIQYVVADSPSSRSQRRVRTAWGMVSRQERKAPVQARIVMITGLTPRM
jgi:hypothetical protein